MKKTKISLDLFADRLRYIATIPNRLFNWKEEEIALYRQFNRAEIINAYKEGVKQKTGFMSDSEIKEMAEEWFNNKYEYKDE